MYLLSVIEYYRAKMPCDCIAFLVPLSTLHILVSDHLPIVDSVGGDDEELEEDSDQKEDETLNNRSLCLGLACDNEIQI